MQQVDRWSPATWYSLASSVSDLGRHLEHLYHRRRLIVRTGRARGLLVEVEVGGSGDEPASMSVSVGVVDPVSSAEVMEEVGATDVALF